MRRADRVWYILPAVVWAAALIAASGASTSAGHTAGPLRAILTALIGPISDPAFEGIHVIVRKLVHVIAYGIAGALNFRAVRGSRGGWTAPWSAVAVALAVATAVLDEWRQSFVASRTGMPGDVVIDFCGAVLAQMICMRTRGGE